MRQARSLVDASRFVEAEALLGRLVEEDPTVADAYFARGQALLGLGRTEAARRAFVHARDWDAMPTRATSATRALLASESRRLGITAIRVSCALDRASAEGIAGHDLFLDHIHFNPRGHRIVAEALADFFETGAADTCIDATQTAKRPPSLTMDQPP